MNAKHFRSLACFLALAPLATAQNEFRSFDLYPGLFTVVDASADCSTLITRVLDQSTGFDILSEVWTESAGRLNLTSAGSTTIIKEINACSADGADIVGTVDAGAINNAFHWNALTGLQNITPGSVAAPRGRHQRGWLGRRRRLWRRCVPLDSLGWLASSRIRAKLAHCAPPHQRGWLGTRWKLYDPCRAIPVLSLGSRNRFPGLGLSSSGEDHRFPQSAIAGMQSLHKPVSPRVRAISFAGRS